MPDSAPVRVEADGVVKRYGAVAAVDGVSLDVPGGAFVSLLGPSGCGKTTLLRLIGGFESPDAGAIRIGGRDVTRLAPQDRPTAMVFQSYALFPTMTVGENVGYGLSVRGVGRAQAGERVTRALARVDLAGLGDRSVAALSGGQQQRVALARAIAVEPEVILFDEPLSNLDAELREATRAELKALQREIGVTSLYVTHDQSEALAMSDRIALMRAGQIEAEGTPEALYAEPPTAYAASFLGGANVIRDAALAAQLAGEPMPPGMALAVRPEALEPVASGQGVPARVLGRLFLGLTAEWAVEVGDPASGSGGLRLRLWTDPARAVPEALGVRAGRWRWVRDGGPSAAVRRGQVENEST
ncbi:ABC transporter ATP-binding protein [Rubrivirga sp. IMCC45206]|uniref:ABC transporter ATP-binding protein n=1 Tax=Rubrivirga sp. IMCC45206 TaxID=3391614 RepID=UPI0039902F7F